VVAFTTLAFTGVMILMVHPRLYWGESGNDLMQPLLELPISRNYKHGGWADEMQFYDSTNSPISANRTYDIFNKNDWGRSLHFLAGWLLVLVGTVYLVFGAISGHFWRSFVPRSMDLSPKNIRSDLVDHLRLRIPPGTGGPDYGLLQKITYGLIVFVALPLVFLSGVTMAPMVVANFPLLLDIFGGHQSARTIHFFSFIALLLFLFVHVLMVYRSGFRRQMQAMTIGVKDEE
jgi:thiosulfate reductase cytochrome b subunit